MRFVLLVCSLLVLLAGMNLVDATEPAFKVTITSSGLDYVRNVTISYLQGKLASGVQIPDQSSSFNVPVLGDFDYNLQNIVLAQPLFPQSSITLLAGAGITLDVPHISGSGDLDVGLARTEVFPNAQPQSSSCSHLENFEIKISVSLGIGPNGTLVLSTQSVSVDISSFDIHEQGGASWFYKVLIAIFQNKFKNTAQDAISSGLTNLLNNGANQALATAPITEKFSDFAEVDYSLVSPPNIASNYLTLLCKGEFYYLPNKTESDFPIGRLPDTLGGSMMQVFFSEYVPYTAASVFKESGKVQATITDKDLPAWSPMRLNTSSWSVILPELAKRYPNMAMTAEVYPSTVPLPIFSPMGVEVQGQGMLLLSVLSPSAVNDTPISVVGLNIFLDAQAEGSVDSGRVYINMTYLNSSVSVAFSKVGDFDIKPLELIIAMLCNIGVIPFFNFYLSHGISIPTVQGVTLVSPKILYGDHYLAVATNFTFTH